MKLKAITFAVLQSVMLSAGAASLSDSIIVTIDESLQNNETFTVSNHEKNFELSQDSIADQESYLMEVHASQSEKTDVLGALNVTNNKLSGSGNIGNKKITGIYVENIGYPGNALPITNLNVSNNQIDWVNLTSTANNSNALQTSYGGVNVWAKTQTESSTSTITRSTSKMWL